MALANPEPQRLREVSSAIPLERQGGAGISTATKYRPDIDGLRAVAVLAVVIHHLSPSLVPGGYIGVDVFFVISGYLITKIIHAEMVAGTFTFASFYERRVRRIFPALFAVIASVLVVGWVVLLPSDYVATFRAAIATVVFGSNILSWRELADGYFADDAARDPLLHMWSLSVEEQFYIVFPFLLFLCMRYAKRWLIPILVTGAVLSLAMSMALIHTKSVAVFFLSPFRGWELLVGCIGALAQLPQPTSSRVRAVLAWLAFGAILLPAFTYTTETVFPGLAAVPPALGTAMLIHLGAAGSATTVSRSLAWQPMVAVGLMSYSLYIWHWPVIIFAKYMQQSDSLGAWSPGLLVICFALAWASHRFIEQPARRRPFKLTPLVAIGAGVAGMLLLVAIGVVGLSARGFESRWPAQSLAIDRVRTAAVPFRECESSATALGKDLCVIGDPSAQPDALLWGDSHMRAWLPGFDAVLRRAGRSAWFATNAACPPLVGIKNPADTDCHGQNLGVLAKLREHPEIRQVVLSAFWQRYFSASFMELSADLGGAGNPSIAPDALRVTLQTLASNRRDVVVLGPVPSYPYDLPVAVARNLAGKGRDPVLPTILGVRQSNALFYLTIGRVQVPGVRFVDVATWMCRPACEVYADGILYQDANHLSVFGATRYAAQLQEVMAGLNSEEPDFSKATSTAR